MLTLNIQLILNKKGETMKVLGISALLGLSIAVLPAFCLAADAPEEGVTLGT
mgnify:CR=1 FL=1